ncbi:enoyl-CoA hydratase-related protein [Blastococcus sp. SYSU DS0973]
MTDPSRRSGTGAPPADRRKTTDLTELRYEVADGVATVTLHRPDRLNAFTLTMADELARVAAAADADDDVRVVVVTGSGRAFCAGADLGGGPGTFGDRRTRERPPGPLSEDIAGFPRDAGGVAALPFAALRKPVIAAVNGPAVGIGATLTLPMDVRIAAKSARFGFVFGRVGIVPEAASSWFLPRVVGISQAMEWVATGRVFDAAEALRGRLVSRVVPDDELLPAAYGLAHEIVENTSAVAVGAARQLLWSMLGAASPWDAHRAESRALVELGDGPDPAEGVAAFLEKRPPRFPGRLPDGAVAGVPRWPAPPDDVTG